MLEHGWDVTPMEAKRIQEELRRELVLEPPPGFAPRLAGGADMSFERFATRGYAGVVVLDTESMETVAAGAAETELAFPYVPGFLSFRELPPIMAVWEKLERKPDVLVFDGQGTAHPRRFGVACHGGLLLGVPSIGCAKSVLVGTHGPLGEERGSTAALVHRGETVGMAVRTRTGVKPVYVSPGHRMDLDTAVEIVLRLAPRFREPETTRRSHQLVNDLRRKAGEERGRLPPNP